MSKNEIKNRIVEELRKTKEAGQITTEKVHKILERAVFDVAAESKKGVKQLRSIVKDAVDAAITGLKETEADTKKTVEGAIEGAIAGAQIHGDHIVESTRQEIQQLETRLAKEESQLAENLTEGLKGAMDAGETLSGDAKKWLKSAIADIKLKSTQLSELTSQTVKKAKKTTKAANAVADGTRKFGKKSANIAKGAVAGMWKGAKDAIKKEKENK